MSAPSREVLVIGAGIAGLTAARDLAVDGCDVAILKARERIGGRIWTSRELGLPATWGHRQIAIPVQNGVLFAAEATSEFFPATVHGAFLSGVRAAYEIMLADAKVDLMKDAQGEVDTYV